MSRPPLSAEAITTRIVNMIKESDTRSRDICDALGVTPHEITRYIKSYIEDGRIAQIKAPFGAAQRMNRVWAWTEGRSIKAATNKHKCLRCRETPVPGGATWVCPRCKSTAEWASVSPFAIA